MELPGMDGGAAQREWANLTAPCVRNASCYSRLKMDSSVH